METILAITKESLEGFLTLAFAAGAAQCEIPHVDAVKFWDSHRNRSAFIDVIERRSQENMDKLEVMFEEAKRSGTLTDLALEIERQLAERNSKATE